MSGKIFVFVLIAVLFLAAVCFGEDKDTDYKQCNVY
jgi:hypothetical protein